MIQLNNSQAGNVQHRISRSPPTYSSRIESGAIRHHWRKAARDMFALIGAFSAIWMTLNVLVPDTARSVTTSIRADSGEASASKQLLEPLAEPFDRVAHLSGPAVASGVHVEPHERTLAAYVARNFRIATDPARALVASAYRAARGVNVDPLLLVAVIAIESRFNPIAESDMGAKGLMQIIPKYHLDKLDSHGGEPSVLDPEVNIRVGAEILKEYIARAGGVEAGLQWYNGASTDPTRQYADRVLSEYDRLAPLVGRPGMPRSPKPIAASGRLGPIPETPPSGVRIGEST
jgi:Transglycosylase SLT domain